MLDHLYTNLRGKKLFFLIAIKANNFFNFIE
jgi:hypothetical protein